MFKGRTATFAGPRQPPDLARRRRRGHAAPRRLVRPSVAVAAGLGLRRCHRDRGRVPRARRTTAKPGATPRHADVRESADILLSLVSPLGVAHRLRPARARAGHIADRRCCPQSDRADRVPLPARTRYRATASSTPPWLTLLCGSVATRSSGAASRDSSTPVARSHPARPELGPPLILQDLVLRPQGLGAVHGGRGQGKTTSQASCSRTSNALPGMVHRDDRKHPIEKRARASALRDRSARGRHRQRRRSANRPLRPGLLCAEAPGRDPVGEMRDLETMSARVSICATGHRVLSTLHTHDAVQGPRASSTHTDARSRWSYPALARAVGGDDPADPR